MFNMKHGKIIIDMGDALGESLDVCDQAYGRISNILQLPVAMVTPEVRQVLIEIERTRDSILYVSNILAGPYGGIEEEEANGASDKEEAD